ncbi:Translocation protein S66 [Dispira simplex]|nr:Translocation protein S66 [Dispira simplex]
MSSYILLAGYAAGWALVFGTFVNVYHRRKKAALAQLESWFPEHTERNLYYSLLEAKNPVPEATLQAALLKRASTDVQRAIDLQTKKQALSTLVKAGSIGEDLFNQFQAAEAELENEMMDVAQEANTMRPGWGQGIFQVASEMLGHSKIRELRSKVQEREQGALAIREQYSDYYEELEKKRLQWKEDEANTVGEALINESSAKGLKKRK